MSDALEESSLLYHSLEPAGKLAVTPTKPLANQIDLAQAYSPGVAFPCERIRENPLEAALYTTRSNLVGVVTNGSAVLGLGDRTAGGETGHGRQIGPFQEVREHQRVRHRSRRE